MELKESNGMSIIMPQKVAYIIDTLYERGYEAFAVGGCIRDSLLGIVPKDWDITTDALPTEIKHIFPHTVDTGIEHGTVTVIIDREGFEVTTYRIDGEYEDARHPKNVEFTSNLKLDLMRRDFTINAMAYNYKMGLVDEFDGEGDLKQGIIRCVGDATKRFDEDALRILRAIRFSARFGFLIDEDTKEGIRSKSHLLCKISAERIKAEMDKILISKYPERLLFAAKNGVFDAVLIKVGDHLKTKDGENTIDNIKKLHRLYLDSENVTDEKELLAMCWTLLIYDYSLEDAKEHYKNLKSDNYLLKLSMALIKSKTETLLEDEYAIRKMANKMGVDIMPCIFLIRESVTKDEAQIDYIRRCEEIFERQLRNGYCMELKSMNITGTELIQAGIKPGKNMGDILRHLLEHVLKNPKDNIRENLINIALEYESKNLH
ncbi:MAG: CCA tRNA nucleotidyltransferase [Lachnospiraceae bacterium]|nr:CCA tRNA nucleotidyltransferase [Lachnospiraceae bacterium]